MQDPSTKKAEAVKAAEINMDEGVQEQPIAPMTEDIEEKDPDYLLHDMDGGEG